VPLPALQIIVVGTLLLLSLVVQTRLWPWRSHVSNIADMLMTLFINIVLLGVAPLLEIDKTGATSVLGTLLCVPVLAPLAISIVVSIWMGWRQMDQSQKRYDVFLCHHKGGAGALARFLKIRLTAYAHCSVFLDADCLESLDGLFDIVRQQTKTFVVILTQELLKRMWCAGEIVTAHKNSIPIVPVKCDGFVKVSDTALEHIPTLWPVDERHSLASYGIQAHDVVQGFKAVLAAPAVDFLRFGDDLDKRACIEKIALQCNLSRRFVNEHSGNPAKARILLTGAVADAEALSVCEICRDMIQKRVQVTCDLVRTEMEVRVKMSYASYFVVLLSRGLLRDPDFARILVAVTSFQLVSHGTSIASKTFSMTSRASDRQLELVSINADPSFEFPGQMFFEELRAFGLGFGPQVGAKIEASYRQLVTVLALPLSPHGSAALMKKQMEQVCTRFKKYSVNNVEGLAKDLAQDDQTDASMMSPACFPGTDSEDGSAFGGSDSLHPLISFPPQSQGGGNTYPPPSPAMSLISRDTLPPMNSVSEEDQSPDADGMSDATEDEPEVKIYM